VAESNISSGYVEVITGPEVSELIQDGSC